VDVVDIVRVVVVMVWLRNGEPMFDPSSGDFAEPLNVVLSEGPAVDAIVGDEVV
jgi:hypothetical protein